MVTNDLEVFSLRTWRADMFVYMRRCAECYRRYVRFGNLLAVTLGYGIVADQRFVATSFRARVAQW